MRTTFYLPRCKFSIQRFTYFQKNLNSIQCPKVLSTSIDLPLFRAKMFIKFFKHPFYSCDADQRGRGEGEERSSPALPNLSHVTVSAPPTFLPCLAAAVLCCVFRPVSLVRLGTGLGLREHQCFRVASCYLQV
jgi:hypothetical protein